MKSETKTYKLEAYNLTHRGAGGREDVKEKTRYGGYPLGHFPRTKLTELAIQFMRRTGRKNVDLRNPEGELVFRISLGPGY